MNRGLLIALIVGGVVVLGFGVLMVVLLAAADGIGGGAIGYTEIEGTLVDSRDAVRGLRQLDDNPFVKAILVRVESPGGGVTPSHEIYSEIRRIRESGTPVVVSMGTVAASGGYYVSAPASVIVANPGTLTGSIGVIMELPVVRGLMEKVGVKVEVVKSAESKDIGSPFREMTQTDRALLQGVVTDVYDQFVQVVSSERELPEDSVRKVADGRILTGRQAQEWGLVDSIGTLEDAKRICADLAGIKGEPRLVRPRPRLNTWLARLMESTSERLFGAQRAPRLSYRWF